MKPKWMPAWLDAFLWKWRYYRRNRMRSTHQFTLSPYQVEMLQEKLAQVPVNGADVYYMKADVSRWDDKMGTPQTGRIAFQIPFSTPSGGPRTIYANVDIVMGDLMAPKYFSDGLNHHYAFDKSGMGELLRGSEFDVVQ